MGTRGIMGVRIDGQDLLTYNHFDSYPNGLGVDIVDAIKKQVADAGLDIWRTQARKLNMVQGDAIPNAGERIACPDTKADWDWYGTLRERQGDLPATLAGGFMIDNSSFIFDSLFCEWGWIVNLDDDTLEVYKGFQTKSHDRGRYSGEGKLHAPFTDRDHYFPCALIATFPLSAIPEDWLAQVTAEGE